MAGVSEPPLRSPVSYMKQRGTLELSNTGLSFTQDGHDAPIISMKRHEIGTIFASKDGAPATRLKVHYMNVPKEDQGYNFLFLAQPVDVATRERNAFKDVLAKLGAQNKNPVKPKAPIAAPGLAAPVGPQLSTAEIQLRVAVLEKNPELQALHNELVIRARTVTDSEFWLGREHLLLSESGAADQRRGKAGPLLEIQPQLDDGKVSLKQQRINEIFDAFPIVKKIHDEHVVTGKLAGPAFWKRYFQSKLFDSHRNSIRTSAAQHVVKGDPLFDAFLEPVDGGLEPRRQNAPPVSLTLDLAASREDHRDGGNEPDLTMRAGTGPKGVLPLIRRFNAHSEHLLTSALGERPAKRRRLDEDDEIDLPDLHGSEAGTGIALVMSDRQRYFDARSNGAADGTDVRVDVGTIVRGLQVDLGGWARNLNELHPSREAGADAFARMTETVSARKGGQDGEPIPKDKLAAMKVVQSATGELLRQYWSAVYPPPEVQVVGPMNPTQRVMRAGKMVGYLENTRDKVQDLANSSGSQDIARKIQTAMKPLLEAVAYACEHYDTKFSAKATPKRPPNAAAV